MPRPMTLKNFLSRLPTDGVNRGVRFRCTVEMIEKSDINARENLRDLLNGDIDPSPIRFSPILNSQIAKIANGDFLRAFDMEFHTECYGDGEVEEVLDRLSKVITQLLVISHDPYEITMCQLLLAALLPQDGDQG